MHITIVIILMFITSIAIAIIIMILLLLLLLFIYFINRVRIPAYSGPHFPTFGLNTERDTLYLSVFSPNAGNCGPE